MLRLNHKSKITLLLFSFILLTYSNIALCQVAANQNEIQKADSLIESGKQLCSIDNDKAVILLQEAFTISTTANYQAGIARCYLWLGRVYYYKDEYMLAVNYLEKALNTYETLDIYNEEAFTYFGLGEIYRINGNYIEAHSMYKKALEKVELSDDKSKKPIYMCSLGSLMLQRHKSEDALKYFNNALEVISQYPDSLHLSSIFALISMAYEQMDKYDTALTFSYKALKIREAIDDKRNIASSKHSIGGLLILTGDYARAEEQLAEALILFTNLHEKTGRVVVKQQLALAQMHQNKKESVRTINEAYNEALKLKNPWLLSEIYSTLSEIYSYFGDYENSYSYLLQNNHIADSIFNIEKERIMAGYEAKYEAKQNEIRISELQTNEEVHKYQIYILTILVIAFGLIIIMVVFIYKYKSSSLKDRQMMLQQKNIIEKKNKQIIEKENQILKEQLESKNRELASKVLEMIRFNDTISVVINKLEELSSSNNNKNEAENIRKIIYELEHQSKQNIWNEFDKIFKNIHSGFYEKLLEICPELSPTEIKMAALLKLNLTTKEIAAISFKSEGGIKTARYRLRKKLDLSSDENLIPFLLKI